MNFNKINEIIAKELSDDEVNPSFYYLEEIVKLAEIIIKNSPTIDINAYKCYVPIEKSVQLADDFFKAINPKYSYMFQNILMEETNVYNDKIDYSVKFSKTKPMIKKYEKYGSLGLVFEDVSFVKDNGLVVINYSEELSDVFNIVHEMTHKFSTPKSQIYHLKHFFGEVPSISMEFLLKDYLIKNTDYGKDEILIYCKNRLMYQSFFVSVRLIFEHILINIYKDNENHVSKEALEEYFNSLDRNTLIYKILITKSKDYLNSIINNEELIFSTCLRYIIGIILACDFQQKIFEDAKNINQLFCLIDLLGNFEIFVDKDLKIIQNLDIPMIHNSQIIIEKEDMVRVEKCFLNEISRTLTGSEKTKYEIFRKSKIEKTYARLRDLIMYTNAGDDLKYDIAGRKIKKRTVISSKKP